MNLTERCNRFLSELGVPVTVFCRQVAISPRSFYDWKQGRLRLSDTTLGRIENHISKYGF